MGPSVESSSEPAQDREVAPTGLDVVVPMPDTLVFEASRARGAAIVLKGSVPAAPAAAYFGGIAGDVPTDALTIATGLPIDFITNGIGGIDALTRLNEGRLGFDGARWWLRGKVETAAVRDAVTASIAALPKVADWSVAVDLLAPIEVCRDRVGALAGRNAILFQSGKATLIDASLPVLDELATDLGICPGTYVHVEGHTDADGAEELNLALSVSRAEAVVAALIERGVDEARLYAEGYGESEPIAPNDTKQGKQQNRRIAFTITEE